MNKKSISASLLGLFFVVCLGTAAFSASGEAIFCKSVDEQWKPVEPAKEFNTNVVSTLFVSEKPFSTMETVVSLYHNTNNAQELLHRETVAVNPQWNALFLQDIPLPSVGSHVPPAKPGAYHLLVTPLRSQLLLASFCQQAMSP